MDYVQYFMMSTMPRAKSHFLPSPEPFSASPAPSSLHRSHLHQHHPVRIHPEEAQRLCSGTLVIAAFALLITAASPKASSAVDLSETSGSAK